MFQGRGNAFLTMPFFVFKITRSGFVIKNKEITFLANRKKAGDVRWFVAE